MALAWRKGDAMVPGGAGRPEADASWIPAPRCPARRSRGAAAPPRCRQQAEGLLDLDPELPEPADQVGAPSYRDDDRAVAPGPVVEHDAVHLGHAVNRGAGLERAHRDARYATVVRRTTSIWTRSSPARGSPSAPGTVKTLGPVASMAARTSARCSASSSGHASRERVDAVNLGHTGARSPECRLAVMDRLATGQISDPTISSI